MRMNKELEKMTGEWMQLERKTIEQRQIAEQFYDDHLMKLIEEDYIRRNQMLVYEEVSYLVVSVGTSYEPIVLNIQLLQPKKILFLFTERSEFTLNKIIAYCGLLPVDYEKRIVNAVDPIEIYREVKRAYLLWGRPQRMYIDITGGTKTMSATAAMAGALIDVQLVYVATDDYLVDFRKPNPGSEKLSYIDNPLAVFGDLEADKAFVLFDKFNFAGAARKLSYLKESIPEPDTRQELNFVYLLSRAYEEWDGLDFVPACEAMSKLKKELERDRRLHPEFLMMDLLPRIEEQAKLLECLQTIPGLLREKKNLQILQNRELMHALMFTMYQNAMTREQQEKYDMATLLLYRLLEMIEQRRLSHYNLFVSNMEYLKIKVNLKQRPELKGMSEQEVLSWLKEEVNRIKIELFRTNRNTYLPEQVSLLEDFVILEALGDAITRMPDKKNINLLKQIRSKVLLRNNSIFAHGLGPVEKADYIRFRDFVVQMFQKFCGIEKIDFGQYQKKMEWIMPRSSRNYVSEDKDGGIICEGTGSTDSKMR